MKDVVLRIPRERTADPGAISTVNYAREDLENLKEKGDIQEYFLKTDENGDKVLCIDTPSYRKRSAIGMGKKASKNLPGFARKYADQFLEKTLN